MNCKGKTKIKYKGELSYKLIAVDGSIIEHSTGNNLVVAGGRDAIAKLIGGDGGVTPNGKWVVMFGIGTDGTAAADADTALTGAFDKAIDSATYPTNGTVQINFTITTSEANGMAIQEFGLYCEDGTLFARRAVTTINKTNLFTIAAEWRIIF